MQDSFADGIELLSRIDWERMYNFMRCHSTAYVVMGAIKRNIKDYSPDGIEMNDNGEIDLKFSGE